MYTVTIEYTHSYIEPKLDANLAVKINDELKYRPNGYRHTWAYKHKKWDGYNYLFDLQHQKFRTGLVWRVMRRLELEKVEYTVIDSRVKKPNIKWFDKINLPENIKPYEFQEQAILATNQDSHCIIASPTGTGKTIIMALIAKLHKRRTLIVVNNRVLLDQTWDFFSKIVPSVKKHLGIVGSGDFKLADITISTIQSIGSIIGLGKKRKPTSKEAEFKEWLSGVDIIIHDEVHGADNKTVDAFYASLEAYNFIGMTATPYPWATMSEKGKNLEMEQHFGKKTFDSRKGVNFIKLGITVPLYIYRPHAPVVNDYAYYEDKGSRPLDSYMEVLDKQIINNQKRIEFIAYLAASMIKEGKSCYVYYNRIAYGEALCEAMAGLDPIMLQGKTSRVQRAKIFDLVERKKVLLVVSDIGSYGLNIKSLDVVILAFPVKDVRQIKGRACRFSEGKETGMIIDPIDCAPYFLYHAKIRANQYKADGDVIVG